MSAGRQFQLERANYLSGNVFQISALHDAKVNSIKVLKSEQ